MALAWLDAQPGVTSIIIGARRLAQLEDNVQALEVNLTPQELAHLAEKTKPALGFPADMQPMFPAIHNGDDRERRVRRAFLVRAAAGREALLSGRNIPMGECDAV